MKLDWVIWSAELQIFQPCLRNGWGTGMDFSQDISNESNMVRTIIDQIKDTRMVYTKGIIILWEASMMNIYNFHGHEHKCSRSTPTSTMHNFSFTSLLKMFWVWKFTWWNTRRVWPVKTFGFTRIADSTDTTHRGILSTYTTHDRIKGYKLESKSTDNKS